MGDLNIIGIQKVIDLLNPIPLCVGIGSLGKKSKNQPLFPNLNSKWLEWEKNNEIVKKLNSG